MALEQFSLLRSWPNLDRCLLNEQKRAVLKITGQALEAAINSKAS
jgi:hypothetical protein